MADNTKKQSSDYEKEKTVADVFNELTDEQKQVVYAMIGQALEDAGVSLDEDEPADPDAVPADDFEDADIPEGDLTEISFEEENIPEDDIPEDEEDDD